MTESLDASTELKNLLRLSTTSSDSQIHPVGVVDAAVLNQISQASQNSEPVTGGTIFSESLFPVDPQNCDAATAAKIAKRKLRNERRKEERKQKREEKKDAKCKSEGEDLDCTSETLTNMNCNALTVPVINKDQPESIISQKDHIQDKCVNEKCSGRDNELIEEQTKNKKVKKVNFETDSKSSVSQSFKHSQKTNSSNINMDVNENSASKSKSPLEEGSGSADSSKKNGKLEKSKTDKKVNNVNNNKPYKLTELNLSPEFEKQLETNKIHVLKKKAIRFPNAKFFCRLCDYHLDAAEDCEKHMKDTRHIRRKEIADVDSILNKLPEPSDKQIEAVTEAAIKVCHEHGLAASAREEREKVVRRLETVVREKIPDVMMFMYGSSLTCFGLLDADININLNSSTKDRKLTYLLKEVFVVLKDRKDIGFSDIRSEFSAKVPAVKLTDQATDWKLTVTIHCYAAQCSSQLLSIYSDFDPRVRQLAQVFRYWARLCGLDKQSEGFIPPQALNLMVIYFLHNMDPQFVPVIQPPKVSGEEVGDFTKDAPAFERMRIKVMKARDKNSDLCDSKISLGELWLRLLRYYTLEFDSAAEIVSIRSSKAAGVTRAQKPWNSKKLGVEDPYMEKKNVTRMVNNSRIWEYWQDSIRKASYYFGLPRNNQGKSFLSSCDLEDLSLFKIDPEAYRSQKLATGGTKEEKTSKSKSKKKKKGEKTEKLDSAGNKKSKSTPINEEKKNSNCEQNSVSSRESSLGVLPDVDHSTTPSTEKVPLDSTNPSLSVDKLSTSPKTSESENSVSVSELPESEVPVRSEEVKLNANSEEPTILKTPNESVLSPETNVCVGETSVDNLVDNLKILSVNTSLKTAEHPETPVSNTQYSLSEGSNSENKDLDAGSDSSCLNIPAKCDDICVDSNSASSSPDVQSDESECDKASEEFWATKSSLFIDELLREVAKRDCGYEFSANNLTNGKGPSLVCTYCEKEGHLKDSCPEDELPEVLPLPVMTKNHLDILSKTLWKVPEDVGLSPQSFRSRNIFLQGLEEYIRQTFSDAKLQLFGSSCNGFGFDKSDMDICMTFLTKKDVTKINKPAIIETLYRELRRHPDLTSVQPIPTAKVPIVKFTEKRTELEGDICLYNTLAQKNTHLLHSYSLIDKRVKVLGYTIKTFAKVCDIGDASRGSLSSYAYILMMLYYLQQVQPPVLPVLQELHFGERPHCMVENCDAWFMDDLKRLSQLWPEGGKNKSSVAELWLGFLRFYVEEFDYKEFVVCIRQKQLLTRFEKLWNGKCIAIEDPFDLAHNLGSGLNRKMNNFIFKTFINGRMLYGSPIDDNLDMYHKYNCPSDYFFDTELLAENRPLNARGCRKCGKIGHLQRHCPVQLRENKEEKTQRQARKDLTQHQQNRQRYNQRQQQQQQQQHYQHQQQRQQQHHHPSRSATQHDQQYRREQDRRGPGNQQVGQYSLRDNPRIQPVTPGQVQGHMGGQGPNYYPPYHRGQHSQFPQGQYQQQGLRRAPSNQEQRGSHHSAQMAHQQGYSSSHHNTLLGPSPRSSQSAGPSNYNLRSPHTGTPPHPSQMMYYNSNMNNSNNMRSINNQGPLGYQHGASGMNPVVQNLFASAQQYQQQKDPNPGVKSKRRN